MKTFTVIGLGRFGTSVATQLFNMGYEVLAIDKNMDKINAIASLWGIPSLRTFPLSMMDG